MIYDALAATTFRTFCTLNAAAILSVGLAFPTQAVPSKLKRECRSDYKTFCPHYKIGTSKMRTCMRSNGRQLSWGCYQALKDHGYVKGRHSAR
jgi:hypothetical protein